MGRKILFQKLIYVVTMAGFCLLTASPAASQVIDSGTVDRSLECVGVAVVGVDSGDSLNVREGPGVVYGILLTLEPAEAAIATGLTEQVGNSTWYQIGTTSCEPVGWVNSAFLELTPGTTAAPPTSAAPATTAAATTVAPQGNSGDSGRQDSNIELSLFTTALLGLGVFGLLTGVIMAVRGRRRERVSQGPPPGMVGPPGGPYLLAPVNRSDTAPQVIQVGGGPKPVVGSRGTDPHEDLGENPVSAFPHVPDSAPDDLSSSPIPQTETEKTPRPSMRLFGTTSLATGNATEDEQGS